MSIPTRLAIFVLVAAAAAVVAYKLATRHGGKADAPAAPPGSPTATGGARNPAHPAIDPRTGKPVPGAGSAGGANPTVPDEIDDGDGDPTTRTYVMDNGAVIRDHRGSGYPPPINPPPMRPDARTMSTVLTARIYQQLAPLVAACAAAVPAADRGADPFTYVTLTVKVAKGQLTTTDVYPTIHDVNGASATAFPSCVADKAKGITLASGDEPDHDDYIVQYPIRLK